MSDSSHGGVGMSYIGYVDELSRFCVAGWAAHPSDWKTSLTVDIIVEGKGVGAIKADVFRQKLDEQHPDATGRYAFKFYFSTPLSMYHTQNVSVSVRNSAYSLIQDRRVIESIKPDRDDSVFRPSAPILLTTTGRTGSTAVMA